MQTTNVITIRFSPRSEANKVLDEIMQCLLEDKDDHKTFQDKISRWFRTAEQL